ncbi:MAG: ATP-binding protein, partial [Pikeienuella sp.]
MADGLKAWLAGLDLAHLGEVFAEHEIAFADVRLLSDADLREMGIALGPRRRILSTQEKLKETPPSISQEPSERRQVTVMFADLVGSTELSARLDPEDLEEIILAFHKVCEEVMVEHDGYIAEYLGDGAVIYFGWPVAREDAAVQAGRAALKLIEAVTKLKVRDDVTLQVRLGASTGLVVVAERLGPDGVQRAFITGATPNIAARLQGLAEPGGVVFAGITARLAGHALRTRSIGNHTLKGVPESVEVFEVLEAQDKFGRFLSHSATAPKPMIGCEEELATLTHRWCAAVEGRGEAILLVGEAGIGKSRIVAALTEEIGNEGQMMTLQCSPIRQGTAFWPIACYLAEAASFSSSDSALTQLNKLEALFAELADEPRLAAALSARAMGVADPSQPWPYDWTPQRERTKLMATLETAIQRMTAKQPLLILVEDAHWIDPTTLELLQNVVTDMPDRQALALITSRPNATPELNCRTKMTLTGLNASGVRDLIVQSGGGALAKAKIEEIVDRADGVPLFVEELTRTVVETGEGDVPASLKDTLMARLDQDRNAKEAAQIAAGLGRVFPAKIVGSALGWSDRLVEKALKNLTAAGVIYAEDSTGRSFAFKHALVRDVAYETVLKAERSALHQRIYDALTEQGGTIAAAQPEIMAFHAGKAGFADVSTDYWRHAAEQAIQRSAHLEALGHYRKALAQLMKTDDDDARTQSELELQLAIGVTAIQPKSHGSPEVRAAFRQAVQLSQRVDNEVLRFRALRGLWHWHSVNGDFDEAARRAEELVSLAEGSDDTAKLMAHRIMGYTQLTLGAYELGISHFETALSGYDPEKQAEYVSAHGEDPGLWCYAYLAWANDWLGKRDQALAWKDQGVALARRLPNGYSKSFTLGLAAQLHRWRKEPDQARAYAREAIEIAENHSVSQFHAWSSIICGWAEAALGDLDGGLAQAEAGFAHWRSMGLIHVQWRHLILLAEIHRLRGEPDRAMERVLEAESTVALGNDGLGACELQITKGEVLQDLGETARGENTLTAALKLAGEQNAGTFELRASLGLARAMVAQDQSKKAAMLL